MKMSNLGEDVEGGGGGGGRLYMGVACVWCALCRESTCFVDHSFHVHVVTHTDFLKMTSMLHSDSKGGVWCDGYVFPLYSLPNLEVTHGYQVQGWYRHSSCRSPPSPR